VVADALFALFQVQPGFTVGHMLAGNVAAINVIWKQNTIHEITDTSQISRFLYTLHLFVADKRRDFKGFHSLFPGNSDS
jgi:hypothetical protein